MSKLNQITLCKEEVLALLYLMDKKANGSNENEFNAKAWLRDQLYTEQFTRYEFARLPEYIRRLWAFQLELSEFNFETRTKTYDESPQALLLHDFQAKFGKCQRLDYKLRIVLTRQNTSKSQQLLRSIVEETCGGCYRSDNYLDIWYPDMECCRVLSDKLLEVIMQDGLCSQQVFNLRKQAHIVYRQIEQIERK